MPYPHVRDLPPLHQQPQIQKSSANVQKAYSSIYNWQESVPPDSSENLSVPRTYARLLGYLILHAPTLNGQEFVAREINSANNNQDIYAALANQAIHLLMHCCALYCHASVKKEVGKLAWLRETDPACRLNDRLSERISGRDANYALSSNTLHSNSQTLHIMPRCKDFKLEFADKKIWSGSVWVFMAEYADINMFDLNEGLIDDPSNLIQLVSIFAELVDHLRMTLVPVRNQKNEWEIQPDEYTLWYDDAAEGALPRNYPAHSGSQITLKNHTPANPNTRSIPLPNPKYWALHAAATMTFQFSGAIQYLQHFTNHEEEDQDEFLDLNGSSCFVLHMKMDSAKISNTAKRAI
ncbi:hypothetical protein SISNIDRAFT_469899 [Sistotremastrum niveocremeum HHB9708]|uniref:HNH nuclease domain-containing protein n=1 Tax=Sistotremastrum niveocremeum HHB9708 TaxID=1314777 RepID=A0A164PKY9_9AGAM|nr:hypothetical protein SISNIDRAFT_469899 [Sistotremastrum niveocremeum HHB9708]